MRKRKAETVQSDIIGYYPRSKLTLPRDNCIFIDSIIAIRTHNIWRHFFYHGSYIDVSYRVPNHFICDSKPRNIVKTNMQIIDKSESNYIILNFICTVLLISLFLLLFWKIGQHVTVVLLFTLTNTTQIILGFWWTWFSKDVVLQTSKSWQCLLLNFTNRFPAMCLTPEVIDRLVYSAVPLRSISGNHYWRP